MIGDADDFYVFIYEEEIKDGMEAVFQKKKNRRKAGRKNRFKADKQRVLGFWCFNPGVGFKQI